YGNCITELVTEMPRSCSSFIQSDVAWRAALRPLTEPAIWIAPPNSSSFSVSVVLPASGCEMIAQVRRRSACWDTSDMGLAHTGAPAERKARNYRVLAQPTVNEPHCDERPDSVLKSGLGQPLSRIGGFSAFHHLWRGIRCL